MNFFLLLLLLPLHPVAEYSIVFVMFVLLQILKVDAYTNTNTCMYVCLYIIYNCLGVCANFHSHILAENLHFYSAKVQSASAK